MSSQIIPVVLPSLLIYYREYNFYSPTQSEHRIRVFVYISFTMYWYVEVSSVFGLCCTDSSMTRDKYQTVTYLTEHQDRVSQFSLSPCLSFFLFPSLLFPLLPSFMSLTIPFYVTRAPLHLSLNHFYLSRSCTRVCSSALTPAASPLFCSPALKSLTFLSLSLSLRLPPFVHLNSEKQFLSLCQGGWQWVFK